MKREVERVAVKELPEVEFVMGWSGYSPGQRIRPPGTLRDFLIAAGYARLPEKPRRGRPRLVRTEG